MNEDEGCTRWKLGMPEVKKEVRALVSDAVYSYLTADQDRALSLLNEIGTYRKSRPDSAHL